MHCLWKSKTIQLVRFVLAVSLVACITCPADAQTPLGTVFTYQGQLRDAGSPVDDTADFQFRLYDALSAGNLIAGPVAVNNVTVAEGLFTASIDFGAAAFNGQARWLEVAARTPAGGGTFTTLTPRQPLTAAPYARFAASSPWTGLSGIPAGFADGIDQGSGDGHSLDAADGSPVDALYVSNAGNVGIGTVTPSGKVDIQASDNSNVLFGRRTGGGLTHNLFIDGLGHGSMQLRDSAGAPRVNIGSGDTTYFNYGNVGIGTVTPLTALHAAAPTPVLTLQDSNSTTNHSGYVQFLANDGVSGGFFGFGSQVYATAYLWNSRPGGGIALATEDVERVNVSAAGDVGIGTGSPAAKLDVRGDVKLGPSGQYFTPGGEENLRIIRGVVDGDGSVLAGSGFTSSRSEEGNYTLTWNTPFASRPSVTATALQDLFGNDRIASGWELNGNLTTLVNIVVRDLSGNPVNSDFNFIAIGPR